MGGLLMSGQLLGWGPGHLHEAGQARLIYKISPNQLDNPKMYWPQMARNAINGMCIELYVVTLSHQITTEIWLRDGKNNAKVTIKCNNFYDLGDYNKTT